MTPTLPNGTPQTGHLPAAHAEPAPLQPAPSPKEALGVSPTSGLLKPSIQAGVGFAVLLAGLTFGPYFWEKSHAATNAPPAPAGKTDAPAAGQPPTAPAPSPATPDPNTASKVPAAGSPAAGKPPAKGDILDKLGESGTKTAPAKVNPLDKKEDDILKDIK